MGLEVMVLTRRIEMKKLACMVLVISQFSAVYAMGREGVPLEMKIKKGSGVHDLRLGERCRIRVYDHFGDVYIDRIQNHTFGTDSIQVKLNKGSYDLADFAPKQQERPIKVVFEDGSTQRFTLQGKQTYPLK